MLRYLPSSMTYEEIAADLYLSPNTVKSHVYSVFRKLGVNGRRQAVRSARELSSCDRQPGGAGGKRSSSGPGDDLAGPRPDR